MRARGIMDKLLRSRHELAVGIGEAGNRPPRTAAKAAKLIAAMMSMRCEVLALEMRTPCVVSIATVRVRARRISSSA